MALLLIRDDGIGSRGSVDWHLSLPIPIRYAIEEVFSIGYVKIRSLDVFFVLDLAAWTYDIDTWLLLVTSSRDIFGLLRGSYGNCLNQGALFLHPFALFMATLNLIIDLFSHLVFEQTHHELGMLYFFHRQFFSL